VVTEHEICPVPFWNVLRVLIELPLLHFQTASAYRWLDADPDRTTAFRFSADRLTQEYTTLPASKRQFFNAFADVLRKRFPVYDELMSLLSGAGAGFVGVSGSGAVAFGAFDSADHASRAWDARRCSVSSEHVVELLERPSNR
jgi:4-diphosphocytidyl-2C-methyl-D-erythritol kinase